MFLKSFMQTLPVFLGYIPLGVTFGVVSASLNLDFLYGILTAILIFTGAGQFLLLSLLSLKAGLFEIAIAAFLLNVRHIFYTLSLLDSLKEFGISKFYIIFGITDETFAILQANKNNLNIKDLEKNYFYVTLLDHVYWVFGCGVGIFLGEYFSFNPKGVEFVLTALFVTLTLSLLKSSKNRIPFFIALILGIFGLAFFPKDNFLILSLVCGILILLIFKNKICKEV